MQREPLRRRSGRNGLRRVLQSRYFPRLHPQESHNRRYASRSRRRNIVPPSFSPLTRRALAAVSPPDVFYDLHLPQRVIDEGLLSSLQLETVIYASQRHQLFSPQGYRYGFLLGDGAGVGKGRQLAGIIAENWMA